MAQHQDERRKVRLQSLPKGTMGLQESEVTGIGQEVLVEVQFYLFLKMQ